MTQPEETHDDTFGRIEVVPEVLLSIADQVLAETEGVVRMAPVPSRSRRTLDHEGIALDMEDGKTVFDLYVIMNARENIITIAEAVQNALVEAVERMIGIPVDAVNVHIEDVDYPAAEAV